MPFAVNFVTESDQDFVAAFVYGQAVDAWDAETAYASGTRALYANVVWLAVAASTGVTPGSDITKWTRSAALPIDLTGSTLLMMVRADPAENYAPISLTSEGGNGITINDAVGGSFTITIPNATLGAMPAGDYVHSLVRVRPDGLRELIWNGKLTHSIGPTR
jgi:hypothetical protein